MLSIRASFSDSSRDVAMATNFGQDWQNDLHSAPWHFKTKFNIAMWIRNFYSGNDPSTSCTNMVNFGRVTPEIEVGEICTFETIQQKAAYVTEYLNNY